MELQQSIPGSHLRLVWGNRTRALAQPAVTSVVTPVADTPDSYRQNLLEELQFVASAHPSQQMRSLCARAEAFIQLTGEPVNA